MIVPLCLALVRPHLEYKKDSEALVEGLEFRSYEEWLRELGLSGAEEEEAQRRLSLSTTT